MLGGGGFEDSWHKCSVRKLTTTSNFRFLNLHPPNPGSLVRTISLSTNLVKWMKNSPVKLPEPKLTSVVQEMDSARFERLYLSNSGRSLISCVSNILYVVVSGGMTFDRAAIAAGRP